MVSYVEKNLKIISPVNSKRASSIKASITMAITALANQLEKRPKTKIISAFRRSFDTLELIKEANMMCNLIIKMVKQNTYLLPVVAD